MRQTYIINITTIIRELVMVRFVQMSRLADTAHSLHNILWRSRYFNTITTQWYGGNDRITTTIHWYWFKLMGRWWSAVSDETKPGPVGVPWYICGNDFLHVITKLCGNTSNKNTVTKDFPCRIGVGIHGEKDCNQRNLCTFDLSVTNDDLWGEQRQMWCVPSTHHLPATCRNHYVHGQKKSKEPTTTSRVMEEGTL